MKFIIFSLIIIFVLSVLSAEPVNVHLAQKIADLKIQIEKLKDFSIEKTTNLYFDNDISAYIFHLNPQGFIIVSANTDIIPIISYSFRNNFSLEETPENIALQIVKADLKFRMEATPFTDSKIISKNNQLWRNYINGNYSAFNSRDEIWPPEGYSSTGGWVEVLWDLYYPYWNFAR